MTLLAEFVAVLDVWDVAQPYIQKMVDEQGMRLLGLDTQEGGQG